MMVRTGYRNSRLHHHMSRDFGLAVIDHKLDNPQLAHYPESTQHREAVTAVMEGKRRRPRRPLRHMLASPRTQTHDQSYLHRA